MPDNPNTDNPPIETEAWEIALKPYARHAEAAFDLARRLMEVKRYLKAKPPNVSMATSALDEAVEILFPFTDFQKSAYDLYLTFIDGTPTRARGSRRQSGDKVLMGQKRRPRPQFLATKLLAIRQRLGVSQSQMVRLLDFQISVASVSVARVSEYENGIRKPNLLTILAYSRAAGVPVEKLIDDDLTI